MITSDRSRTAILLLSFILSLISVFVMYKFIWKNMLSRPVPESEKVLITTAQPTDLKTLLDMNTKNIIKEFSGDEIKSLNKSIAVLKKSIKQNNFLNVNDKVPDLKLQFVSGGQKRLSELFSENSVVLMWYWGDWSSYCDITCSAYQNILSRIKNNNGKLIIITPEKNVNSLKKLKNKNIQLVFDENNRIAKKFGLVFEVPAGIRKIFGIKDNIKQLPLPATYIINTQGIIKYAFLNSDLKHRADPNDVLEALKQINTR